MKVFVDTYGCAFNKFDSAVIESVLKEAGHEITSLKKAEAVVINSCAVKLTTENRMISIAEKYLSQGKKVVMAGCLPRVNFKRAVSLNVPLVDTNSINDVPKAIEAGYGVFFSDEKQDKANVLFFQSGITGVIGVSEGCLGNCYFCGTKNARGVLKSYKPKKIMLVFEKMIREGKKEVFLTSQDNGCYGRDIGFSMPELIGELTRVEGDYLIRIGMANPPFVFEDLDAWIEMLNNEKAYKFLHIPIQSGSDRILKLMNGQGNVQQFEEIVREVRKEVKDVSIATDIIVGFPGETEEDFKQTLSLIKKTKPDITNVSMFYPRPNTKAVVMKKVSSEVMKRRSAEISSLARRVSRENNEKYVGKSMRVLITGKSKDGKTLARAPNYKQVIIDEKADGFVMVEITSCGSSSLKAQLINTGFD